MPSRSQYALMSSKDKNMVMFVCFSSAVAFFDFLIYLYMADIVSAALFPIITEVRFAKLQSLVLFAVGYLARPLGGVILGRLGDIHGRKPILLISMLVTAFTLLAMACLPTFAQWGFAASFLFIILRLIQGMAFGIFVPLAWVFVAEHVPRQYLSLGCSYVTASFFVGVLFSNLFFSWLTSTMTPEQLVANGWRLPFVVAAILSFLPLIAWRFINETPFFEELVHKQKKSTPKPMKLLFKHCGQSIFIALMLTLVIASITTVVVLLLPDLIELSFTLDSDLFGFSHSLGIGFMIFGCVFYGLLSGYQNFGKILIIGSALLIAQSIAFFYHLQAGGDYVLIMYALLGFFSGIVGMVPAILVQLFPTNVRLTGLALSYNIMYAAVGGFVPFILGYAVSIFGFAPALYMLFIGAIGVIMGLYFYHLPEFRGINEVIND